MNTNMNTKIILIIPNTNTNNTECEYKKQRIPELRTEKIAYRVFCAYIFNKTTYNYVLLMKLKIANRAYEEKSRLII